MWIHSIDLRSHPSPLLLEHILGQINWRGQILPLLELGMVSYRFSPVLPAPRSRRLSELTVSNVGIGVDRIFDVFYLASAQIDALPLIR